MSSSSSSASSSSSSSSSSFALAGASASGKPAPSTLTGPVSVLITGAARGIGLELVRQYASQDSRNTVIAAVRDPKKADNVLSLQKEYHNIQLVQLDVSDEQSIVKSASAVSKLVDHLDILVNNAGVFDYADKSPLVTTRQQLLDTFTINVAGPLTVTQNYLPLLQAKTDKRGKANATVLNVSSGLGSNIIAPQYASALGVTTSYGTSKAALNYINTAFTHTVKDVIFISLHPGYVDTDMSQHKGVITTKASADGIRQVIATKTIANSGEFVDYEHGTVIPF